MVEFSLLNEGIFRVTAANGAVAHLSLPQVLAQLSAGHDLVFDNLRPHQRAPWHAFLVQLAYLALEHIDDDAPPLPEAPAEWTRLLCELAAGHADDGPWCLVNDDWQRPAFLQPPCSKGRESDFKHDCAAAQDIDVLVTARHHDEKSSKLPLGDDTLDTLVYALVVLQGWASFMGRGNYNSMRMNGGFSSRPQFRLAFTRGSGPEFQRDLRALLDQRDRIGADFQQRHPTHGAMHCLLWLNPWDDGSLPLGDVHPLCLEVCRRVRLVREQGALRLRRAGSDTMRVAAKDARGDVLDPWVPIVRGDQPKALTAQAHSLGYRSLQAVILDADSIHLPLLARQSPRERHANQPGVLLARVLVSGDGGTDGLLQRDVPIPAPVLVQLRTDAAALASQARQFVHLAGLASGKVLRSALLQFVDGSADVDWKNRDFGRAVQPWVDAYEQAIDAAFFSELFASVEAGLDELGAQRRWAQWLCGTAGQHLAQAMLALPTRDGSRRFARARAEQLLRWSERNQFGALLAPAGTPPDDPMSVVQAPEPADA